MGNLRAAICAIAFGSLALGACGDSGNSTDAPVVKIPDAAIDARPPTPDAPPLDASPYDFSCYGMPFATTADANVTASGSAQEIDIATQSIIPSANVTIKSYLAGSTDPVDTTTSDSTGAFATGSIATGGSPAELHLVGTKPDYRDTLIYPGHAVSSSISNAPVLMVKSSDWTTLMGFLGGSESNMQGSAILMVVDCAGNAVSGASVTMKQNGSVVTASSEQEGTLLGFPGVFFEFGVPAGATDVSATFGTMTFPVHAVEIKIATNTLTQVIPGPQN